MKNTFLPENSRNGVNRGDQVILAIDSLLTKHMQSHLCVIYINKANQWTGRIYRYTLADTEESIF